MPRANRHESPVSLAHHRTMPPQTVLLKFARDRRAWVGWLYEARQRFGLCVLDYQVTSNHVHLLVADRGADEIAASLQLIAGRTGRASISANSDVERSGRPLPRHGGRHREHLARCREAG